MVSNPSYAPSAMAVAARIVKEEGFLRGLYEGFSFVLARQVLGFTLLYSALLCFTLLYSALLASSRRGRSSALLCFTVVTRLCCALLGFTLLYSALLCFSFVLERRVLFGLCDV